MPECPTSTPFRFTEPTLGVIAAALGIIGTIFKWWTKLWNWIRRRRTTAAQKSPIPTSTLRLVVEHGRSYPGPEWSRAKRGQEEGMGLHVRWTVTNIANV